MTTLALPRPAVKPTTTTRRRPSAAALARALDAALRRLESLIPGYHAAGKPRRSWIERVWFPANEAADRAEKAVLAHLQRRGVGGFVAAGRLYLDLCYFLGDLSEYRGTSILVVELADVPDLATAPDPADAAWVAVHNADHHTAEPTPAEVLGDGPADDDGPAPGQGWDDRAAESAALDRYERGCLLV
jgi:hypothetical protein